MAAILTFLNCWLVENIQSVFHRCAFLIDLRDIVFFASLIGLALFVNVVLVDLKKGS